MTSRLKDAASPYLEEAAEQPVDWHLWGEEAFEKAKAEDKPILVDSGAVWCHWCHVMDHESYADPEIGELINDRFVAIKLDRDERPEIDGRLQRAVAALSGQGGWPLTAFLTPEGEVFFGGTYFPPEPTRGMPAFGQVLNQVADTYEQNPERAREQARKISQALEQRGQASGDATLAPDAIQEAVASALGKVDPAHGGFGQAPKFPHIGTLELLLDATHTEAAQEPAAAFQAAVDTLEAMARGGIQDHLAGGFHRYSVDRQWHVPHFEKMLYDNGPLAGTYARAAALAHARDKPGHAQLFEGVARRIAGFMLDVLEQPAGGFGGSQDADRRPETSGPVRHADLDDGSYFTWTYEDAKAAIDDDQAFRIARLRYGIEKEGDMEHDPSQNVLRIDATVPDLADITELDPAKVHDLLEQATQRLVEARAKREAPIVDPTIYASWNGMAIEGLLELDRLHGMPEARQGALRALNRLCEEAWDPGTGFLHALSPQGARVAGLLDDQAQMLGALLAAHRTTDEQRYLERAKAVGSLLVDAYQLEDGRLRETLTEDRAASAGDQPTPAAPAVALLHLPRLARLTGEQRFLDATEHALSGLAGEVGRLGGLYGATLHRALLAHRQPPPHVVIIGGEGAKELVAAARRAPDPLLTQRAVTAQDQPGVPENAQAAAQRFEDEQVAIVCQGSACQVHRTPEELETALCGV